jgi:chemotaxis protein CheZ
MSVETNSADSEELEDLFDRLAQGRRAPSAELTAPACGPVEPGDDHAMSAAKRVLNSVGQLTRQLHDTLAELGYDRSLQECAAATLPDARQRLAYVVTLTEQAASRSLSAVELATPMQEKLAAGASALGQRWGALLRGEASASELKLLAHATHDYLATVPTLTDATRAHLREIVMAQEFQDLTGQVLKRVTDLASHMETQLLKLLVENVPLPLRDGQGLGRLNGPAIAGGNEIVVNQAQVDELLESLGF